MKCYSYEKAPRSGRTQGAQAVSITTYIIAALFIVATFFGLPALVGMAHFAGLW